MNSSTTEQIRLFVVGCPRSGTTWISYLLEQHPQVAVFEHSKLFHYLTGLQHWWKTRSGGKIVNFSSRSPQQDECDADQAPNDNHNRYLTKPQLFDLCRTVAEGVFAEVALSKPNAHLVVDKTPENSKYARFLLNIFPDAYFLHVIRDPRSVFASMKSAGRSWARKEFPTHPADGARFWRRQVERTKRVAELTPNYQQVRYEDFAEDGANQLSKLFEWLNLDADQDLSTRAIENCQIDKMRDASKMPGGFFRKGLPDAWREDLNKSEVRLIEYLASDMMQELGYDLMLPQCERKPFRLTTYDAGDQILGYCEKTLRCSSRRWLQNWRGRETDYPEWVLY